jgi:hypothetical protein
MPYRGQVEDTDAHIGIDPEGVQADPEAGPRPAYSRLLGEEPEPSVLAGGNYSPNYRGPATNAIQGEFTVTGVSEPFRGLIDDGLITANVRGARSSDEVVARSPNSNDVVDHGSLHRPINETQRQMHANSPYFPGAPHLRSGEGVFQQNIERHQPSFNQVEDTQNDITPDRNTERTTTAPEDNTDLLDYDNDIYVSDRVNDLAETFGNDNQNINNAARANSMGIQNPREVPVEQTPADRQIEQQVEQVAVGSSPEEQTAVLDGLGGVLNGDIWSDPLSTIGGTVGSTGINNSPRDGRRRSEENSSPRDRDEDRSASRENADPTESTSNVHDVNTLENIEVNVTQTS